jgi:hypothetical protein
MKQKISAMIGDVADGYLQMGKDQASIQELLDDACLAWNIACLNEEKRAEELKRLRTALTAHNKTWSSLDVDNHIENIELLITRKNQKYPNEKIQILKGEILLVGAEMQISIATIRKKQ